MSKLRTEHYWHQLKDKRLNLTEILAKIEDLFPSAILIETSLGRDFRKTPVITIEYTGGFPNRFIASSTMKKALLIFKQKLKETLKDKDYDDSLMLLRSLILQVSEICATYSASLIRGGIIINGRTASKTTIRKDELKTSVSFCWKTPAEIKINENLNYQILNPVLAPVRIREEFCWHLTTRASFFQELLATVSSCQQKLVKSAKKNVPQFHYIGKQIDAVSLLLTLYGSGHITGENGNPVDPKSFVRHHLKLLNIEPSNPSDLFDQLLTTDAKSRTQKIQTWMRTGLSGLLKE